MVDLRFFRPWLIKFLKVKKTCFLQPRYSEINLAQQTRDDEELLPMLGGWSEQC